MIFDSKFRSRSGENSPGRLPRVYNWKRRQVQVGPANEKKLNKNASRPKLLNYFITKFRAVNLECT